MLSELPCGSRPMKARFLQRNRLIAALSRATVVVEAAHRSGAISTAGHAAGLARPLGAVPGSIFSAVSAGCHRVLREYGGVVIRGAADAAELAVPAGDSVPLDGLEAFEDPVEQRVRDVLAARPRTVLDLARRAGLSVDDVLGALGMLSLSSGAVQDELGWRRG